MGQKLSSALFAFLILPLSASAQVVISEIMYDVEGTDSDREWIEVHNTGNESVDLTQWKFFESNSNHGLTAYQGGEMLTPGGYAVIVDAPAKFLLDWPSFSGQIFDSSFALNNTGETLVLRCCGKDLSDRDSVTYNATGGGTGDGLSLHRNGSSITAAQPSPGSGVFIVPPSPQKEEVKPEPALAPKTEPKVEVKPEPVVQKEEAKASDGVELATEEIHIVSAPVPAYVSTSVVQEESPTPAPKPKSKTSKKEEVVVEDPVSEDELVERAPVIDREVNVAAASAPHTSNDMMWWFGAAAISLFGAGGAYVAGRSQRMRDWKIEEME